MSGTPRSGGRLLPALLVGIAIGCRDGPSAGRGAARSLDAGAPWSARPREPTPPRGMLWIPEGALIAGTPPGRAPRVAEAEMPGEQLVLRGFFIDQFPYPNEEGAIPETGVTLARADRACAERGKRLCTELEWERACKGPRNSSYEYGDRYRPEVCATGRAPRLLPSGFRASCRSDYGVRDLHGGVWEWTQSRWGRGNPAELFVLRGGNALDGELVGRCANAQPRAPQSASAEVGFRCCKGELNAAQVTLAPRGGASFEPRPALEPELAAQLEELLPAEVRELGPAPGAMRFGTAWDWEPIGQVPLLVAATCRGAAASQRCGVLVAELGPGPPQALGWVWVGKYPVTARLSKWDARKLWVRGSDRQGYFRQAVLYEAGRVRAGELVRSVSGAPTPGLH